MGEEHKEFSPSRNAGETCAATPKSAAPIRLSEPKVAAFLRERADWLKYEYFHGGSYEYLKAKEDECLYLLKKIQGGDFTAEAAQPNADLLDALRPFMPITTHDTPDYAEVTFGEHQSQAMTMCPQDWQNLTAAFEASEPQPRAPLNRGEGSRDEPNPSSQPTAKRGE